MSEMLKEDLIMISYSIIPGDNGLKFSPLNRIGNKYSASFNFAQNFDSASQLFDEANAYHGTLKKKYNQTLIAFEQTKINGVDTAAILCYEVRRENEENDTNIQVGVFSSFSKRSNCQFCLPIIIMRNKDYTRLKNCDAIRSYLSEFLSRDQSVIYRHDIYETIDILSKYIDEPIDGRVECHYETDKGCDDCLNRNLPINSKYRSIFGSKNFPRKDYCTLVDDKHSSIIMYILISVLAGYLAAVFSFQFTWLKGIFFTLGLLSSIISTLLYIERVLIITELQRISSLMCNDYKHNDELFRRFMMLFKRSNSELFGANIGSDKITKNITIDEKENHNIIATDISSKMKKLKFKKIVALFFILSMVLFSILVLVHDCLWFKTLIFIIKNLLIENSFGNK